MKTLIRFLTVVLLSWFGLVSHALAMAFIETQTLPSIDGPERKVQVFAIDSRADLSEMVELIKQTEESLQQEARKNFFITVKYDKLDSQLQEPKDPQIVLKSQSISHSAQTAVREVNQNKNLYRTLALVRLVAVGGVTAAGLVVIDNPASMSQALITGLVAGGLSGLIQLNFDLFYKVMTTVYSLKLYKNPELLSQRHKMILDKAEYFLKWGTVEAFFLLGLRSAMMGMDLPVDPIWMLGLTTLKGMVSQGVFEKAWTDYFKRKIEKDPAREIQYKKVLNFALLAGSAVAVSVAVADMSGLKIANWGFASLFGTGLVLMSGEAIKDFRSTLIYHKVRKKVLGSPAGGELCRFVFLL